MAGKNYTREELKRLVDEFTTEFDSLVKNEVAKTGQALNKSEDGGSDKKESKEESSGGDSGSSGSDKGPPSGGDSSGGGDASAGGPPPADAGSASAGGPPAPGGDPASVGGVPPADPAAGASAGDPVQALTQAYSQLSPEELQSHFFALQQVLQAQMGGGAGGAAPAPGAGAPPGADPMAASAGAPPPGAGAPAPTPGGAGPAPMAGEGSKPVDPMASMAMKSMKDELDLVKSERDALKKSLTGLSETLEKLASKPQYKATQATDAAALNKSEQPKTKTMTTAEIKRKLIVVAQNPDLKKSDRTLINKYCVGGVEVDAIAHLLV